MPVLSNSLAPLAAGRYRCISREKSSLSAAANGHLSVWPKSIAISDGKRVEFFKDQKLVWSCNASYAAFHFEMKLMEQDEYESI